MSMYRRNVPPGAREYLDRWIALCSSPEVIAVRGLKQPEVGSAIRALMAERGLERSKVTRLSRMYFRQHPIVKHQPCHASAANGCLMEMATGGQCVVLVAGIHTAGVCRCLVEVGGRKLLVLTSGLRHWTLEDSP